MLVQHAVDPALAAEAVVWTANNPQREVWVGLPTWKAILGNKLIPGLLDRYMASKAWDGQFTGEKPQESPDNLFETVEHLHSEKGPFSDRSIYKRPILWTVRNQNFWINETAILIAVVTFFFGLFLGYFGL